MKLKKYNDFLNEKIDILQLKVGDKLKCKKTFFDAAMFPNDDKINKFFVKDWIYDVENIEDNMVSLSIYGTDSKGVDRKIVAGYPCKEYEIELFFDKV